jgi:teichuronic acid biosynthesis glycosyltransferase TuaC
MFGVKETQTELSKSGYMPIRSQFFEFVHRDPQPELLVVTNMWPDEERPVYGIFVERQVRALRDAGFRCDVLYLRGYISRASYLVGVLLFLRFNISARRRYRLTHVHAGETALVTRFFAMRPMIATYHGDDMLGHRGKDGSIPFHSKIRAALVRWHAVFFTATITQSGEMHRRLLPWVRRNNTVIGCGVDSAQFAPSDQNDARNQLGWDENERIVLFAATRPRDSLKRLDLAQAAVAHAEAELGPIRLVVAENVSPDAMPIMMNAADCLLLTSMAEGAPLVVKEAVLCTLPVVGTDVGDVREVLSGISPSAVCKHDARELGIALADVLRIGGRSNGRDRWEELDQSATVVRLVELYAAFGLKPHATDTLLSV